MEFSDVVRRRRMVRDYDPDRPVTRPQLDALVELATHAPSAGSSQGWRFLVLDDRAGTDRYWAVTAGPGRPDRWLTGMRRAPALIVAFADKDAYLDRYAEPDKGWSDRDEQRWPVPYWDVDTGMAALLILLGARDAGLDACFFGVPGPRWDAVRDAFAVPPRLRPVGAITVGYRSPERAAAPPRRPRRGPGEVAVYGSFG